MGVVTAAGSGGVEFGGNELRKLWGQGAKHVSAYQSFAWFYAVNTGQISIRNGLRGPSGVLVTEQAGGLDAVAHARRQLRKSGVRLLVTGGVDSSLCPWGWAAHLAGGELSTAEDPDRAYLPFSADADGHVAGEGGALLVLEDEDSARARGARTVYGELAGYGATFDPRPGSGREPGLRRAIDTALSDAGFATPPRSTWSSPTPRAPSGSTARKPRPSPVCSARAACRSPRPRRRPDGWARARRPWTSSRRCSPCGRA